MKLTIFIISLVVSSFAAASNVGEAGRRCKDLDTSEYRGVSLEEAPYYLRNDEYQQCYEKHLRSLNQAQMDANRVYVRPRYNGSAIIGSFLIGAEAGVQMRQPPLRCSTYSTGQGNSHTTCN